MIPEIGQLSLCFAAALALGGTVMGFLGNALHNNKIQEAVHSQVLGQFVFVLVAFLALVWSFLADDFTVAYVAGHSNTILPWQYKVSAVWGGHEGSFLLWILIMTLWMLSVVLLRDRYPRYFISNVLIQLVYKKLLLFTILV